MRWIMTVVMAWVVLPVHAAGLSAASVERWITAMPEIQIWLDSHQDQMPAPTPSTSSDLGEVFDQGVTNLRQAGLYQSFDAELGRHGYRSVEEWSDQTAKISMAYLAVEMDREPVTLSQLQAQLVQVQAAEGLPPEQVQAMTNMLQSTIAMMRKVNAVPAADRQAVQPFLKQVKQVLGR
ncbi:MAG: hypothetical protein CMI09_14740 [Oceanospirillaceae bacterium]|nr:hypothetical protein [Oceanospirillaceae bacterium]|tara:strand:+ start:364 stop:900 length:537 start_codon:yes stop_codon:yes gene_type:complete